MQGQNLDVCRRILGFASRLKPKTSYDCLILLFIIVYAIVFSFISILKHQAFQTTAWDLGIYEQVIWSTANGRFLWYTVELPMNPSGSFFGIHFAPILLLLLPIYWIFQATETLLILQSVFIALGALPLYLIVKDEMNEKSALAFACIYLLYPPLHGMNLFDFHVQAFLPFFFLSAFYYFKRQKWTLYFVYIILALMTIEFVPFIVMLMGLYGLWTYRKDLIRIRETSFAKAFRNRRFLASILTIVIAIAWFIMARSVLFYYNPSPRPHSNWKEFGDPLYDLPGLLISIITNPLRTIQIMLTPLNEKIFYVVGLFGPVGFISFFSPPSLLIGSPWFLASLISNFPSYYKPVGYQYVGFIIPFIFVSAFYGSKRLIKAMHVLQDKKGIKKSRVLNAITLNKLFLGMMLLSSIFLAFLASTVTLPQVTYHDRILENVIKLIPSNTSVLTQNDIFPHLSRRLFGYIGNNPVGNFSNTNFDYILVDTTSNWYIGGGDFTLLPLQTFVPKVLKNGEYGLITAVDGIWLLKKDFHGTPTFPVEKGIFGEFYDTANSTGKTVFESVFLDTEWDWAWQVPFPTTENQSWSATFNSYLYVPTGGAYQFGVSVNGICKLYIDDKLVLDLTGPGFQSTKKIVLREGIHSMEIKYIKAINYLGTLKVSWKTPFKESFETISYENLLWNSTSRGE